MLIFIQDMITPFGFMSLLVKNSNRRISLTQWYRSRIQVPVIALIVLAVGLVILSFGLLWAERRDTENELVQQTQNLVAFALEQHNRGGIEAAMMGLLKGLSSDSILLCDGRQVMIRLGSFEQRCGLSGTSWLIRRTAVSGHGDLSIEYSIRPFKWLAPSLPSLFAVLMVISGALAIGVHALRKLRSEIIEPMLDFGAGPSHIIEIAEAKAQIIEKFRIQREFEASSERFKLARQVAHDIRSPLSAMNVALDSGSEVTAEGKALLKVAVTRLSRLADDLLKGRLQLSQKMGDLESALAGVLKVKEAILTRRLGPAVKFEVENIGILREAVLAEDDFIRVIDNILTNAIEAMPGGGLIQVCARRSQGFIELEVADQGCGIPPEIVARLGRDEITFGKEETGNGLGVLHAFRTLNQVGGAIRISSTLGRGTSVYLRIPAESKSE